MRSTVIALTLTALSVIWGPGPALAQAARTAKGTITAIGGQSLTVKVGDQEMAFNIDNRTLVTARGASTKATSLAAAGKPGPQLADLLRTGQAVAVTYSNTGGSNHASEITAIPRASAHATATSGMRSLGVVTSIGANSITISGKSGGGASFEQTFKIDPHTKVFAKGASTAVAAKGGRAPFMDLVSSGDQVSVSYRKLGDALLASDVHVTMKVSH